MVLYLKLRGSQTISRCKIRCCASPTRGEDLSISAKLEGVDGICVAFELSDHESMTNVPQ